MKSESMGAILFIGSDRWDHSDQPHHQRRVGGLSLFTRCVRTLERVGVRELWALAPEMDLELLKSLVEEDPHLALKVHWITHSCVYQEATQALSAALSQHGASLPEAGWLLSADRLVTRGVFERPEEASPPRGDLLVINDGERDTGVFWFEGAQDGSLTRLLPESPSELSALGRADAPRHVPTKACWAVIREPADHQEAWRQLRRMLRKPMSRSADGLTSYWVNRPISLLMSRYLVNTPLTPNHVTTFGLILGLLAAWFVSYGTWLEIALGGILLQVSSIIDGVDGELARMRLTSSHSGEWFDTICDDVINLSFLSGLGYAAWSASGEQWIAYYTAGVVAISLTGVTQLYLELIRDGKASHNNVEWSFERGQTGLMTQVMVGFTWIAKRDTYTLLLMCLTVANLPGVTFWIMSVGALIVGGYTILEKLMGFAKAPQG